MSNSFSYFLALKFGGFGSLKYFLTVFLDILSIFAIFLILTPSALSIFTCCHLYMLNTPSSLLLYEGDFIIGGSILDDEKGSILFYDLDINAHVTDRLAKGEPVISVDTKKKELIGCFKNNGQTWCPKGEPTEVKVHDFIEEAGRANPYGVYDIGADEGWVSVGTDHDTAAFAVQTIRLWWHVVGSQAYPNATELLVTADGGGSNGGRIRLWKLEVQGLADEIGIPIRVCHFPPGTSKWNKIEHRLFSFITMNWRGEPLISHEVMLNLIANTKTKTGLSVRAELDNRMYPKGIKVSDANFAAINMVRDDFHGDWNYSIYPRE